MCGDMSRKNEVNNMHGDGDGRVTAMGALDVDVDVVVVGNVVFDHGEG